MWKGTFFITCSHTHHPSHIKWQEVPWRLFLKRHCAFLVWQCRFWLLVSSIFPVLLFLFVNFQVEIFRLPHPVSSGVSVCPPDVSIQLHYLLWSSFQSRSRCHGPGFPVNPVPCFCSPSPSVTHQTHLDRLSIKGWWWRSARARLVHMSVPPLLLGFICSSPASSLVSCLP